MNFRHLNEAFDRLNEKALNEGPGAGYTIKGTTIIKVDNVKVLSKEDNEYDTTYEVSFNGRGTADIEFASYYYGDSLEDVPVVATKAYVDVDTDDINNGYTVEQYIESLFYNEELKIDLIYGGGWLHSTYDGTVASEEYPAENTYADIVITDMKITDEDIIQYIDAVVQGEFENDDYFEESLKESEDITYTPKVRRFKSVDGTNRIINQYYEEPDYPNWGKGERNKKEISDDEYNRFLQTGKLKEDVFYDWKPNTSFAHIKKIYNDVKKRGYKYVNNELEEMHAAMKKVDAKGYTPEQRKQIRSWTEEIWRANRKNESLTKEESEDARKFIRKFCNGQWSDDYVNLIIYAMGEVVMADYREDIEDACSEILKSNSENAWVVIEEKLSASDLFKYCYEEFYGDLSTVCNDILNGQNVGKAVSSYFSTGYNRDKFVQVVRDVISRIDFEDDFDLAEEIDSALIYDEDLWSVIEFYLDPDDIINGNGFDVYMSFVNDVEDIMLEYYSTEDKNESLTESTSRKEREKAYNDLKKFIVKFCNVEWSDEYMDLVIYAVLNSNANVKSNYMNIEDTCSNMLGSYPYAWSTLKEHFGDKQTRYLLGYFVNDVKDIMSKYYSKDESLTEERGNYGHKGPFWYYSKHGMGPGTIPPDVNVVDWYEDDDYNTWIALDGVLTTQELREYELKEQKPPVKDR